LQGFVFIEKCSKYYQHVVIWNAFVVGKAFTGCRRGIQSDGSLRQGDRLGINRLNCSHFILGIGANSILS